jgi:NAD(P)H-nitrite reductase large subunit
MPSRLDGHAGAMLATHLAAAGVKVRAAVHVKELLGDGRVSGVALGEGGPLAADVVLLSTGVRPNTFLAIEAGLAVRKGVVVDDSLRERGAAA